MGPALLVIFCIAIIQSQHLQHFCPLEFVVMYEPTSSPYLLLFVGFAFYLFTLYFRRALRPGLQSVPGPFIARFSGLYRLYMSCSGRGPYHYRRLHEKYGRLVRVGWNHVSVSDPSMIPVIYGAGSKYVKVSNEWS